MNVSEPFIKRPVMTILVMMAILVFGITSYQMLPVSDLPNVDYPTIQVTVSYPGATPDTMANNCAVPLEKQFMTIEGVQVISSTNTTGSTEIVLQFALDKSLDAASTDVSSAINQAMPNLPSNLPNNPTYKKVNPSSLPIFYLAITSQSMDLGSLYDYASTYLGQRISMIEGISQVLTYGAPYSPRIQVNPEVLASMNVGIDEIASALQTGTVNLPTGTLFGPQNEFTLTVDGQLMKGKNYQELVVKTDKGAIVKISQIGRAIDSTQNDKLSINYQSPKESSPAVVLAVQRQAGSNTVKIIEAIKNLLPELQKTLPASLNLYVFYDESQPIVEGVHDVLLTLIIAFVLVVVVTYLSLGKIFNTIIPSIVLPLAIIGTFSIMFLLHFNIDILSLLALTLSIGFLVDDAIVVLENNVRHVQMGESPMEATLKGSKEITTTVISMTLCLVAVFIPMLFLGGVVGRLFKEFAVTIVCAVAISGFISLSLTPLLCSRFIPKYGTETQSKMEIWTDRINEKMLHFYQTCLHFVFRHKPFVLTLGFVSLLGSLFLFTIAPKEFLPDEDRSLLRCFVESRNGTSPFLMKAYQEKAARIIMEDPAVDSIINVAASPTDNEGIIFIRLKPLHTRDAQDAVMNRLMEKLFPIVGISTYISPIPLISLETISNAKALYQYTLSSIDQKTINTYTQKLVNRLKETPGFIQVSSDLQIKQPQVNFTIDRDRASNLKLTAMDIENLFSYAYSTNQIATINGSINQYKVIIETLPSYYKDPNVFQKLYIRSVDSQALIPLSEVTSVSYNAGPLMINHLNGLPSATVAFNLDSISLGDALQKLHKITEEVLPYSVSGSVQGTANVFQSSFANLSLLFLLTFFVIYLVLGILYESFIHPLTVMSTLPPATFGALITLVLFQKPISLYTFVGIIMLLGIVMKNGIMIVDFANEAIEKEKKAPIDAIFQACSIRFRPIMMTTFAAFMGALPIALGIGGASAAGKIPLGLAIVGGLIFSQILTLFLTPVTYYYLEVLQEKLLSKKPKSSIK